MRPRREAASMPSASLWSCASIMFIGGACCLASSYWVKARYQTRHSQPHKQEVPIPLQQTPVQDAVANRERLQPAQGLQTHRDALRQAGPKLSGLRLPNRNTCMVDLMSLDPSQR
jgi:hypothetical protein